MTRSPDTSGDDALSARLTWAEIEIATEDLSPLEDSEDRETVVVHGQAYDALEVLAKALGIEPDSIRRVEALTVLHRLRSAATGNLDESGQDGIRQAEQQAKESAERTERDIDANEDRTTAEVPLAPDFTPKLAQQMQRYRGEWVAARQGAIVGHATALKALVSQIGDEDVSIVFVPLKSESQPT